MKCPCGKNLYKTEAAALVRVDISIKRGWCKGKVLKTYFCKRGQGWHLTHRKKKGVSDEHLDFHPPVE